MNKIISGFALINKPSGPTSHDIIDKLRRATGIKKIGHAGTLDPFASGLLIVAIGREATREIGRFVAMDKKYEATLFLGATSDTFDRTGAIVECRMSNVDLNNEKIESVLGKFIGKQKQVPPMYSAKKVGGKKLYQLARQGKEIEREPVEINVKTIKLISYKWPRLQIIVECSSGTYIRALANDMGRELGCGAYLEELKRTKIGAYCLSEAQSIENIKQAGDVEFFKKC